MEIVAALRRAPLAALLGLVLAAALASGAGRHAARAAPDAALAAFLAAGGSLADICLDGGHGDAGAGSRHCDDCQPRFAATPPPAHRASTRAVRWRSVGRVVADKAGPRLRRAWRPGGPRAPPAAR